MKNLFSKIVAIFTLFMCLVHVVPLHAQLAEGQDKFLGNIHTQGQTPLNFDLYWNQLTPGNAGKWASCEQARDDFNYWLWMDRAYDHAREFGLEFKEHTLVWGHSSGEPSWMSSVPEDEQMEEVLEWFDALSERYPDLEMIDVVNEPLHAPPSYTEALGGDGETGWDWVIWCYEQARIYFPNAALILNEYNVLNYTTTCDEFLVLVELLQERGLIDGIGLQAHSLESIDMTTIERNMEVMAATGLDIYISELDLRGDDDTQLALYQEIFPYLWEHPSVKGITLWGYLEGDMWRSEAYLLAADGVTERPALQWLREYFDYDDADIPYVLNTYVNGEGTITLDPDSAQYAYGTTVAATATAADGYVFNGWTGDIGGSTNPTSLTMTSNRMLTANFVEEGTITTYELNVSISGNGTVTQNPVGDVFAEGSVVTLTATPDDGYRFVGWSGSVSSTDLTIEVTMDANVNLTASFATIPGSGCDGETTITMNHEEDGIGEYCFVTSGTLNYINSWNTDYLEVNGQDFTNTWTNTIPDADDGLIHIHYVATLSYAHFEISGTDGDAATTYALTVDASGSGDVSPTSGSYTEGTEVTLTATPADGYLFSEWSGDASGTTNPLTITMDSDKSITAVFEEDTTESVNYTLTTTVIGDGIISNYDGNYASGTEITLEAEALEGWVFEGWSGDVVSSAVSITFVMDADKNITATFVEDADTTVATICENPEAIDMPYTQNGVGEFCFVTSDDISYVNSWNMDVVEINGEDFTNAWSDDFPDKIDGNYYIYYVSSVSWSHFEAAATSSARISAAAAYPNPFSGSAVLEISETADVSSIMIIDQVGRIMKSYTGNAIRDQIEMGAELKGGLYFVILETSEGRQTITLKKF